MYLRITCSTIYNVQPGHEKDLAEVASMGIAAQVAINYLKMGEEEKEGFTYPVSKMEVLKEV